MNEMSASKKGGNCGGAGRRTFSEEMPPVATRRGRPCIFRALAVPDSGAGWKSEDRTWKKAERGNIGE